jgi:hypothetical protein
VERAVGFARGDHQSLNPNRADAAFAAQSEVRNAELVQSKQTAKLNARPLGSLTLVP